MNQQHVVLCASKVVLAVFVGLSSFLILNEPATAQTLNSKSRVARRASRRGTQRAGCKGLLSKTDGVQENAKTGESCPFIRATD